MKKLIVAAVAAVGLLGLAGAASAHEPCDGAPEYAPEYAPTYAPEYAPTYVPEAPPVVYRYHHEGPFYWRRAYWARLERERREQYWAARRAEAMRRYRYEHPVRVRYGW